MCLICTEYQKGKLKLGEAVRNYNEMKPSLSLEHQKEMEEKLFNNFSFFVIVVTSLCYHVTITFYRILLSS